MNIPITIGFPQLLFLLIGILGLLLIISSLTGRRHRSSESYEIHKEKEGLSTHPRRHRRFRWGRGISGILLLAIALSLFLAILALEADLQTYLGLTREIKVAHIRATPI